MLYLKKFLLLTIYLSITSELKAEMLYKHKDYELHSAEEDKSYTFRAKGMHSNGGNGYIDVGLTCHNQNNQKYKISIALISNIFPKNGKEISGASIWMGERKYAMVVQKIADQALIANFNTQNPEDDKLKAIFIGAFVSKASTMKMDADGVDFIFDKNGFDKVWALFRKLCDSPHIKFQRYWDFE